MASCFVLDGFGEEQSQRDKQKVVQPTRNPYFAQTASSAPNRTSSSPVTLYHPSPTHPPYLPIIANTIPTACTSPALSMYL